MMQHQLQSDFDKKCGCWTTPIIEGSSEWGYFFQQGAIRKVIYGQNYIPDGSVDITKCYRIQAWDNPLDQHKCDFRN